MPSPRKAPFRLKWQRRQFLVAALFAIFFAACDSAAVESDEIHLEVSVTTDKEEYEARDQPLAYITNLSNEPVFLHSCSGWLEWKGHWDWVVISGSGANGWEPPPVYKVDPGQTALCRAYGRPGGLFRYVFDIRDVEGDLLSHENRASNPFSQKGWYE